MTSGGDSPGMNAAIRAVVRKAIYHGLEMVGVERGYCGLILGEFRELASRSVADIIHRGGTILLTARCEEFLEPSGRKQAMTQCNGAGLDGLIVIGGEGSLRGALRLAELGMPVVGIPATIDNDIPCTDYSIGFDTAVGTVVEAINRIRDTATSHERVFLVEVMGRSSGNIALMSGIAGGAESILIPEVPVNLELVIEKIQRGRAIGKLHSIIVVAEGAGSALEIGRKIEAATGQETRVTILGHIQRGGTPTAYDRFLASRLGAKAVEVLMEGGVSELAAIRGEEITSYDLGYALEQPARPNMELYRLAGILSI